MACSGGRDSLTLARSLQLLCPNRVRVLHVNHQLQVQANDWAQWLSHQCQVWQLPCKILTVNVVAGNLEQQARIARYTALLDQLKPNEILVLGHHQQDQAETVLLRLLSGSGLKGLSAMRPIDHRKGRWLWRPLLACSRQQITKLAQLICPQFIDDPANQQDNFDRVFLRHYVWPVLKNRWPAMEVTLSRSATIMQDSQNILQEVLAQDWQQCGNQHELNIFQLTMLSVPRQRLLLSNWVQGSEQYAPPFHLIEEIQHLIMAKADAQPKVLWTGWQFRRYQDVIYRLPQVIEQAQDLTLDWLPKQTLNLPSGQWHWQQQAFGFAFDLLHQQWHLKARQGGEVVHLKGRVGKWPLKKSLQANGLAPWQREQVHILQQESQVFGVLTAQGFWPSEGVSWVENGWLPVQVKATKL